MTYQTTAEIVVWGYMYKIKSKVEIKPSRTPFGILIKLHFSEMISDSWEYEMRFLPFGVTQTWEIRLHF
jgi:hypothetical protein